MRHALLKAVNSDRTKEIVFDDSESSLWKQVGEFAAESSEYPEVFTVTETDENGNLITQAALTILEDGALHVRNRIRTERSRYDKKELRKVDFETGAYDFFKLNPHNMGPMTLDVGGSYGRLGAQKGELGAEKVFKEPWDSCLYWVKYYQLIKDGYRDVSEDVIDEDNSLDALFTEAKNEDDSAVDWALWKRLRAFSEDTATRTIDVSFFGNRSPFTSRMVGKCWTIWKALGKAKDVKAFNKKLEELYTLLPPKIDKYRASVKCFLAREARPDEDQAAIYAEIIDREEARIRSAEAMASTMKAAKTSEEYTGPFGDVKVRLATEEEKAMVLDMILPEQRELVANVYKMDPIAQTQRFEDYCKARNITDTRLFWHGSKPENWISIIKNSLMLNPNAQITGKMFGQGIYTAPDFIKSWGYTTFSGAKWAGRGDRVAYMGIYRTAYGKPYHPGSVWGHVYDQKFMDEQGCDCLHAERGGQIGLRMDEVVFYAEEALKLEYFVEFIEK